jgi:diguanylate cyclase (GGDEF)-like protein
MPFCVHDDHDCRSRRFKRSLTLRYLVALSLVAALSLLSFGVFHHIMTTIDRSAAITAISGSQRLLTQRVLAQCLLLSSADDEETRRDIQAHLARAVAMLADNHRRLLADLKDPTSFVANAKGLADIYFQPPYELDRRMRFFIESTRDFAQSGSKRPALSDPKFLNVLAFGENELLRDLGAVVQEYQHLAVHRLSTLRGLEAAATGAVLLLLVVVALCILRPMVRRICEDRQSLEQANQALSRLAVTDQLTGASNRLRLSQVLASELDRSKRYGQPLSVIMFDIDHFKLVNDTHGHAAGDDLLRELARLVMAAIRHVDTLFRYGGEEFLVTVPQVSQPGAVHLAEKLRALVAGHTFPRGITATISLGVAEFRPGETADALMARVDAALYRAKEGGRNRVESEGAAEEASDGRSREDASGGRGE